MPATKKTTAKNIGFDAMSALNTDQFKDGFEKLNKSFEQVAEFQRESMDAVMSASNTVAGSLEQLSTEQTGFVKNSFDQGMKTAKAMAQCKSPQEALDLNTEFMRSAVESNIAQFNKMTEMMVATGKQAAEPLTDSYNQLVEKVQSYRP